VTATGRPLLGTRSGAMIRWAPNLERLHAREVSELRPAYPVDRGRRRRTPRGYPSANVLGGTALLLSIVGCGVSAIERPTEPTPARTADPQALPPPGYGTLSQREFSLTIREGDVELLVTPLSRSVLVAAAPDTYQRLSSLADRVDAPADPALAPFLVSFHSDRDADAFLPEDVHLITGGLRARPERIIPLTPGWGSRRVTQRTTESALYLFDRPVDLESDLTLEYGRQRNRDWGLILGRVQAERARARARAGPPGADHAGSPS